MLKIFTTKRLGSKIGNLLVIMAITFSLMLFSFPMIVSAESLGDIYTQINTQYPDDIQKMKQYGASENDIKNFIEALESELSNSDTLNDENVKDEVANALITLYWNGEHVYVFDSVFNGWNLDADDLLEAFSGGGTSQVVGLLPESFYEIGVLVKGKLVVSEEKPVASGPGGGGPSTPVVEEVIESLSTEIMEQINNNDLKVNVSIDEENTEIEITVEDINKIFQANKELEISAAESNVKFTIPVGAITLNEDANIVCEAKKLSNEQIQSLASNMDKGMKLASNIFELNIKDGNNNKNIKLNKKIKVALSYADTRMSGQDENNLAIYWFNESTKAWEHVGGKINKDTKTVEWDAEHFSKYAIMVKPEAAEKTFADTTNHWAKNDIQFLATKGLVNGVNEITFQPNREITRAEFATMLVNMLHINTEGVNGFHFGDISYQAWYAKIVYAAVDAKLVNGISPTLFAPKRNITRQEMAAMVTNALVYKGKSVNISSQEIDNKLTKFTDKLEISPWAQKSVTIAMNHGIISGRSESLLAPKANATRAEAAVMMKRLFLLVN